MNNQCPICHIAHYCGRADPSCWCMSVHISKEMYVEIEASQLPKSCICITCLEKLANGKLSTKNNSCSQTVDK